MGVLNKIKVNQAQAADPGIAFSLSSVDENGNPVAFNCGLRISILIMSNVSSYDTDIVIWNPISDTNIVFAVPFGDSNFGTESGLNYRITIEATAQGQTGSQSPFTPFSNVENAANTLPVMSGSFTLSSGSITF